MISGKSLFSSRKIAVADGKIFYNDLASFTLLAIDDESGEVEAILSSNDQSYYRSIYSYGDKLILFSSVGRDYCEYNYKDDTYSIYDIPKQVVEDDCWNWSSDYIEKNGQLYFHWVDDAVVIYDIANDTWEKIAICDMRDKTSLNCFGFADDENIYFPIEYERKIIKMNLVNCHYSFLECNGISKNEVIRSTYYYRDMLWILTEDGANEFLYKCYNIQDGLFYKMESISFTVCNGRIPYYSMIGVLGEIWLMPTDAGKIVRLNIETEIMNEEENILSIDAGVNFVGETDGKHYFKLNRKPELYIVSKDDGEIKKKDLWIKNKNAKEWFKKTVHDSICNEGVWDVSDFINAVSYDTDR